MEDREQSTWKKVAGKEKAGERRREEDIYIRPGLQCAETLRRKPCSSVDTNVQEENERSRYLLLLPAAPSVRLVQQPGADDRVHVDGDALDADQQDSAWTETEEIETCQKSHDECMVCPKM